MREHLFKDNIRELITLTEDLYAGRYLYKKQGDKYLASLLTETADAFSERIAGLEYDITVYENGINHDITETKKEIMERLRRL